VSEPADQPSKPPRTWRPMAAWGPRVFLPLLLTAAACVRTPDPELADAAYCDAVASLKSADAFKRREALLALGEIGTPAAVRAIAGAMSDESGELREVAVLALGRIGGERVVPHLIHALKDESCYVREAAACGLFRGGARAVKPLSGALGDEHWPVRHNAVEALGCIGSKQALKPLIAVMSGDKEARVRAGAAWALGLIGDVRAVEPLISALKDEDEDVRTAAAESLKKIRGEEKPK
jgi:HEAT repeat protein